MARSTNPAPNRPRLSPFGRALRNFTLSLSALRSLALSLSQKRPLTLAAFDRAMALATAFNDPILQGVTIPQGHLKLAILQQAIRNAR